MDLESSPTLIQSGLCVLPSVKYARGKAGHLNSILWRDWQRIELRALSAIPFIALSTTNHKTFLPFHNKHILSESAAIHKPFVSAMRNMVFYTCYQNVDLISRPWKNVRIIFYGKLFTCIHTVLLFRNVVYYLYRGPKIIYFLFIVPRAQNFEGRILLQ
jgi:hypothetical protein